MSCWAAAPAPFLCDLFAVVVSVVRDGRDRWGGSGNVAVMGVEVLEALRVMVWMEVVRSWALEAGPVSVSSLFSGLSRVLLPSCGPGSFFSCTACSAAGFPSSFATFGTSGMFCTVELVVLLVSGALAVLPFAMVCLFEAEDCARWRESGKAV